jgi:hypothetical protein
VPLRLCHSFATLLSAFVTRAWGYATPPASGSLLWKVMKLASGGSAHKSLSLLTIPARLSGAQPPCSCVTRSSQGGAHLLAHASSCVSTEGHPGQAMDLLFYDESTGGNLVHLWILTKKLKENTNIRTFYSAACLGSGFSAQLGQSTLYRSLSCSKPGLTHPLFCAN